MMACIFIWIRGFAGTGVAWVATIVFLLSPFSVRTFQFARFYAIHALLFWLGAVATYAATVDRSSFHRALMFAVAAAACFAGAFYLQITTATSGSSTSPCGSWSVWFYRCSWCPCQESGGG